MPSEDFYIALIVISALLLGMGLVFVYAIQDSPYYQQFLVPGQIMLGLGIAVGIGISIIAFLSVYPSIREWNLERQQDSLWRSQEKIELEKRKWELKRQKAEVDEYIRSQERKDKEEQTPSDHVSNKMSSHDEKSQTKTTSDVGEKNADLKPTIRTGDPVPDMLKNMEEETTESTNQEKSDCLIRMELDKFLKCLLALYNHPEHYFKNISEAARIIHKIEEGKRSGSAEQAVSGTMKELQHYGLVIINTKKEYDGTKKRQINEYRITDFGIKMIEKAIDDDISNWGDFVEKYKAELRDKK